jgi:hypothetical protein
LTAPGAEGSYGGPMAPPDDEIDDDVMVAPAGDGPSDAELSGSYETRFGELTVDDDEPEPDPERRRRNNRLLLTVVAIGGAIVLAIAVVGIVVVNHYLDDSTSITARMSVRYQRQYRTCVEHGSLREECATSAEAACAGDPGWATDTRRVQDIGDICLFGPDAGN